jgi:hypothetical protein
MKRRARTQTPAGRPRRAAAADAAALRAAQRSAGRCAQALATAGRHTLSRRLDDIELKRACA